MFNKKHILSILLSLSVMCAYAQGESFNSKSDLFSETTNTVELYPNPSVEFLIVEIKNSDISHVELEIRSLIGNEVNVKAEDIGNDKYRFNVEHIASGYYFLIIKDKSTQFKQAHKFLKK